MQIVSNTGSQNEIQEKEVSLIETCKVDFGIGTNKFSQVMTAMEVYFSPIDFHGEAKLKDGQRVTTKHYVVLTIDKLLSELQKVNGGLASFNGCHYWYNGAYWNKLSDEELKDFLGLVANKLGIDEVTSKHFSFKDNLLNQFRASSHVRFGPKIGAVLINFGNGTLEIGSDGVPRLREFNSMDYLTYQLPFDYLPEADCPLFFEFLDYILPNKDDQQIIAEFLGYAFLPNSYLKLEKALLLVGDGQNGKSTLGEIVRKIYGDQNVSSYTLSSLCQENGYYRAMLQNKLLNFASEISGKMDTTIAKALISGENIEVRKPYQEPQIMSDYAKLMFASNSMPQTVEHNKAYYRRFIFIEFGVTIPKEKINPKLAKQICDIELPGIFNWVMLGLKRILTAQQFTYSAKSESLLADFKIQSDEIRLFLDDEKIIPDFNNEIPLKDLYQIYRHYCLANGYKFCSNRCFSDRIRKLGFSLFRKNTGYMVNAFQILD